MMESRCSKKTSRERDRLVLCCRRRMKEEVDKPKNMNLIQATFHPQNRVKRKERERLLGHDILFQEYNRKQEKETFWCQLENLQWESEEERKVDVHLLQDYLQIDRDMRVPEKDFFRLFFDSKNHMSLITWLLLSFESWMNSGQTDSVPVPVFTPPSSASLLL